MQRRVGHPQMEGLTAGSSFGQLPAPHATSLVSARSRTRACGVCLTDPSLGRALNALVLVLVLVRAADLREDEA